MGLMLRMAIAIALLFGLLFAFFMGITYLLFYMGYIPGAWLLFISVAVALGIVLLQWGIGPYIIKWIYKIEWIGPDMPSIEPRYARVYEYIRRATSDAGVRMPQVGIVPDDNPNAFTFGWTRNSGHIALTRGVFKYCDDEEAEAVAAHEVGHIVHNDFVVMTVVSAVVLLFFVVYLACRTLVWSRSGGSRDSGKAEAAALVIMVVSYIVYLLSNFIALIVSRYREYWADEFSGQSTRNPNKLSSALVKIAYGLATEGQGMSPKDRSKVEGRHGTTLGIFNVTTARALAAQAATADGAVSKEAVKETMAWDLWNPWAFFYELGMTHPLPAKRIRALDKQAEGMGQTAYVKFDLKKPESYWDDFLGDIGAMYSWTLSIPIAIALGYWWWLQGVGDVAYARAFCAFLLVGGLFGFLYLRFYRYPWSFRDAKVHELLRNPKASPVRGMPVRLRGRIIGRGVPGLFFSEDLKIDDGTGLLLIDYRAMLPIIDLLQGVFATQRFVGQEVVVEGWYRRQVVPYIEMVHLEAPHFSRRVYRQWIEMGGALVIAAIGGALLWLLMILV
jgi:Zn-dependent protease with chaperone function